MDQMDTEELKKKLQAEIAQATFQALVEDMSEKCFSMCIKKPGSSLENNDKRCLTNCMDRFIDSYNVVSKVFLSRVSNEMGQ